MRTGDTMYEPRAWTQDPGLLEPNNGHIYMTVIKTNKISLSRLDVDDKTLLSLLNAKVPSNAEWTLKLLVTKRIIIAFRDIRVLPYPPEILEALIKEWKISDTCFGMHYKAGSASMPFNPYPGDSSYIGMVIRLVYGLPFRGTLAVCHDSNTRTTYAICFGIDPEHAQILLSRLEGTKDSAFFPLHVPYLLTDLALQELETFSSHTYQDFIPVREAMGTNLYFQPAYADGFHAPDLTEMPRRLTALENAAASNCSSLGGITGIVDCMESHMKRMSGENSQPSDVLGVFEDRLRLMRQVVDSALRRNQYLRDSVQAQVQMVYALLAQKDNELSHQHGADMRVIAIVTLIFLPGTFVATFFSASFWDFSPSNHGKVASKWVWLYWVVTVLLTISVLCTWLWWPFFTSSGAGKWQVGRRKAAGDAATQELVIPLKAALPVGRRAFGFT